MTPRRHQRQPPAAPGGSTAQRVGPEAHAVALGFQGALFEQPSFRELCDWYEAHCIANLSRRATRETRRSAIRQALEWMGQRDIHHPDSGAWREYFTFRLQDPKTRLCRSTLDTYRKVLAQVYSFARDTPRRGAGGWVLLNNPLTRQAIPKFREPEPRPRGLEKPYVTFPLLLAAMRNPLERAALNLMRHDLLRVQEVLGIPMPGTRFDRPRHLNLDKGELYVEFQRDMQASTPSPLKTTYNAATIELAEESVRALREGMTWARQRYATPAGRRVYGFAAQHFVIPFFRETMEEMLKACREVAPADFPKWERGVDGGDGFHVLRHTGALALLETGTPVEDLHRMLRHRDYHTTHVYVEKLRGKTVASDSIRESRRVQELLQRRAMAERDGQGLKLVRKEDE